jgi:DNA-binding NtrC family response regulator
MSSQLSGRRVLVVEDEVMVSWILEDMLAELGCEVVGPAAWVDQAIAMIEAETTDLAVLDVNLNGKKSFPVADALVARGVPFVFSTGYNSDGIPDTYKVYPMMQKPFAMANLSGALERLVTVQSELPGE